MFIQNSGEFPKNVENLNAVSADMTRFPWIISLILFGSICVSFAGCKQKYSSELRNPHRKFLRMNLMEYFIHNRN